MINLCDTCKYYETKKNEKPCANCGDGRNWEGFWLEEEKRPGMLQLAVKKYEHDYSKYPEQIRVSFADGHTAIYEMRVDQPHPVIVENIKIIRKWKGYVNQPQRRRRQK